jgi:hypothetical protein
LLRLSVLFVELYDVLCANNFHFFLRHLLYLIIITIHETLPVDGFMQLSV